MEHREIEVRFTYHKPTVDQVPKYEALRGLSRQLAELINASCPESREKSLAVTNLEQAVMWANAAIARREA